MEGFTQYSVVHRFERACGKASLTCEKPHYYSGLAKCDVERVEKPLSLVKSHTTVLAYQNVMWSVWKSLSHL